MKSIERAKLRAKLFPNRFAEQYNDLAQDRILKFKGQMELLKQLEGQPKSKETVLQIADLKNQIQRTLDYLSKTGQSLDFYQSMINSTIQKAQYINAQNIIQQNKDKHKLIDLVDEQRLKDDQLSKLNSIHTSEEIAGLLNEDMPRSQLTRNLRALMQDRLRQTEDLKELLDPFDLDTDKLKKFSPDTIIQNQSSPEVVQAMLNPDPAPSKTEQSILERDGVDDLPEQKEQEVVLKDLADKQIKMPSTQDRLQYMLELQMKYGLDKSGKLKSFHQKKHTKYIDGLTDEAEKNRHRLMTSHFV